MLEKIAGIEQHYEQLGRDLETVGGDYQRAGEINKERVDLEPLIQISETAAKPIPIRLPSMLHVTAAAMSTSLRNRNNFV